MKTSNRKLLIVEDDPGLQSQLKWCFDDFELFIAGDRPAAMQYVRQEKPSVVISDLGLPPDPGGSTEGFSLLEEIIAFDDSIKIVVLTGREEKENAVRAIGMGAYDFYHKPTDDDTLKFIVERAFRLSELEKDNLKLLKSQSPSELDGIIGSSPQMIEIMKTVDKVAGSTVSVLVLGETGTGKSMLVKDLHEKSDRCDKSLVTINCASIPDALLESELFGHEKGAFTGAVARKIGKIEHADGGTIFLDEIGDMPLALQAKILHVLQEKVIVRVGGNEEIPLNIRVVCATHQNLKQRIEEGLFREDLYYRISEIVIEVPSLKERQGDVMLLAHSFLRRFSLQQDIPLKRFSQKSESALLAYNWPGNIRELENKIKRAVVMCDKPIIDIGDLELSSSTADSFESRLLSDVRAQAEGEAIIQALRYCKNISDAAKLLGVTRPTLYTLIGKYQLESFLPSNKVDVPE